jgi:hypothetical protein
MGMVSAKKIYKIFFSKITSYLNRQSKATQESPLGPIHRDKTRVQMPAKIFPHLKVKC